ncbi:uncharacterized protein [Porites lutea]|uniref:uncharacterized protein n=1 Tax=Porites lutea TaxID=51062 RepID=UPI003CC6C217
MILKLKNQNMAASKAVAFQSLACVWFCVSTAAAVQNCSLVNCKVLQVGENIASEFRLKASEKGVRMIYLNLKIGNNSYNPLQLQDEFKPDRWVWARSNKEPMLSLPYDYDILSLGLLNYQVRNMTLTVRDEPSGCLAGLNSTCQNMAFGRALLDNVTSEGGNTEVVCVAVIEKIVRKDFYDTTSIKYHCCRLNASSINCDVPVEGSHWYQAIYNFLIYLAVVLTFYFPALPLLLPDYIFNLQYECDKEGNTDEPTIHARSVYEAIPEIHEIQVLDEIPVDDASPVTCSTALLGCVQGLPDVKMSFNLKLAVLLLCIFPFGFYVNVGLSFVLKEKYFDELSMKVPPATLATPMFFSISTSFYSFEPSHYFIVALLTLTCLMAVLFLRPKDLFLNQDFKCWQCQLAKCLYSLRITENEDSVSIGDKMLHHLNINQEVAYLLMFKFLNQSYFIFIQVHVFLLLYLLYSFFVGILGFTIMGLVLNVETVTPYAAFFVVVVTNIYFCYANLQKSYMEVKGFILKYWQQEMQATLNSEHSTIPAKLFWFVSDKVFPVKTKICLMLGEVAVIVTFLFLTISSIIFFKNEYEISSLVSTIAVFLSGAIPSLFFKGLTKGKKFTGWRKIKLKKKIEAVVTEYVQETNSVEVNGETEEGSSDV